MAQTSFALMTTLGRAKEASALANATTIEITHIAIGDGVTVPSGGETELYNEVARKTISGHGVVVGASNTAYFDAFLAAEDGPYTIREAGLIDSEGDLIAIAKYDPPISKPVPASGQTVEGTIRLEVAFSDVANITIKVDPAMKVALQRLTVLPYIPIKGMAVNDPPVSPAPGDCYVIGAVPTGSWTGHVGKLTEYTVAGWAIIDPPNGHVVGLPDGSEYKRVGGVYLFRGKVKSAIEAAGLVLSHSNQDQLAEAMTRTASGGVYYVDSGAANAYVLARIGAFVPPSAYFDGMEVVFIPEHSNTGASTIKVGGLAAVDLVDWDGRPLKKGRLDASLTSARYRAASGKFRIQPWSKPVNPSYLLGDVTVPYAVPYNVVTTLQYTEVYSTLDGVWDGTKFTAGRRGTFLIIYRAGLVSTLSTDRISVRNFLDTTGAPTSPFGAGSEQWAYETFINGVYSDGALARFAGVAVTELGLGEYVSLGMSYRDDVGSGSRNIVSGKLAIVALN